MKSFQKVQRAFDYCKKKVCISDKVLKMMFIEFLIFSAIRWITESLWVEIKF